MKPEDTGRSRNYYDGVHENVEPCLEEIRRFIINKAVRQLRDRDLAEDIASEVIFELLRNHPGVDCEEAMRLRHTIYSNHLGQLRRKAMRRVDEVQISESEAEYTRGLPKISEDLSPFLVEIGIGDMPPRMATVLVLRMLGMSNRDIEQTTGMGHETAAEEVRRLRRILTEDPDSEYRQYL